MTIIERPISNSLDDSSLDFIENTKINQYNIGEMYILKDNYSHLRDYAQHISVNIEDEYKGIQLEVSQNKKVSNIQTLLQNRTSTRSFAKTGMKFEIFQDFITSAFFTIDKDLEFSKKSCSIPSAGAAYSTDVFVISFNISKLTPGIYQYNTTKKKLYLVKANTKNELNEILHLGFLTENRNDIDFGSVSGILVFASALNRTSVIYKDRGIRYALIEVGSLLQTFYLVAEALDIGICANGGYVDDYIGKIINLKDEQEAVFLTAVFGPKKTA